MPSHALTRFVDVKGVATRCQMAGDPAAPALLLVHGLSLTSDIWAHNIDELAADFHVVGVDLLGHGFTRPRDGQPADIEAKIEHLEDLIEALELDDVSLSASSYGALVASHVVLNKRRTIRRLIINGSGSAFNTEEQLSAFMERIHASYRPALAQSSSQMWRDRMAAGTVLDAGCIPCELLATLPLCYAQPWAIACWEETVAAMRDPQRFRPFRILDRLEEIDVPTLVVWGRDDKGGIYESAQAAVARMPDAELVAFERCAHLPMMEHPQRYDALVRRFLSS
ncbi:MAG: alpha/beta hydrolase [Burkholderiales bacterium]|nr:alpha/beta hydrolase [Burkholderiales bacterium]